MILTKLGLRMLVLIQGLDLFIADFMALIVILFVETYEIVVCRRVNGGQSCAGQWQMK